jgi:hypothetical protein
MRKRRLRFKLWQMILALAVIAALLACYVDTIRIRRTKAFLRRQAAEYAQLENLELLKQSAFKGEARFARHLIENWTQPPVAEPPDERNFPDPVGRARRQLVAAKIRFCNETRQTESKCLAAAKETRAKARRFAALKQKYTVAANRFWLPYMPNPTLGSPPE